MADIEYIAKLATPPTLTQLSSVLQRLFDQRPNVLAPDLAVMLRFGGREYADPLDHDVWLTVGPTDVFLSFRSASKQQTEALRHALAEALTTAGISANLEVAE